MFNQSGCFIWSWLPPLPLVYHLDRKKIDFNSLPMSLVLHAFHPPPVPAYKSFSKCTWKGSKNWNEHRLIKQFACRTSSKTWIRFFEVFFTFLKDPWNKIRFSSVVIFIHLAIFASGWVDCLWHSGVVMQTVRDYLAPFVGLRLQTSLNKSWEREVSGIEFNCMANQTDFKAC